jgi:hypothetical protein
MPKTITITAPVPVEYVCLNVWGVPVYRCTDADSVGLPNAVKISLFIAKIAGENTRQWLDVHRGRNPSQEERSRAPARQISEKAGCP